MTRVITREWLHEQLWQRPATDVARELAMTSTAVAKIARKLAVPVPPPGFWARRRAGLQVDTVTLQPAVPGHPTHHPVIRRITPSTAPAVPEAHPSTHESAPPPRPTREQTVLAAAERSLEALERVASLRVLVDKLGPSVERLPPDAPQRRWLEDARAQIAEADEEALAAIGG